MAASAAISIIFHGNDIDGWMSAHLIASLQPTGVDIRYYPVAPTKLDSWPEPSLLENTTAFIVSATPIENLMDAYTRKAYCVYAFDHHATAADILTRRPHTVFNTDLCSTGLVFKFYFPYLALPDWIGLVDRLTRWQSPTLDDKALREILHPIACMPLNGSVETASIKTNDFLNLYYSSETRTGLIRRGLDILATKNDMLSNALRLGSSLTITTEQAKAWQLPADWIGRSVFILNNSGFVIDSTLAASKVFDELDHVDIFVNYRIKDSVHPRTGLPGMEYVFCARARNNSGINLTTGGIFAGHACAAGARYFSGEDRQVPFVV